MVFLNNSHALASAGAADGYVLVVLSSTFWVQIFVASVSGRCWMGLCVTSVSVVHPLGVVNDSAIELDCRDSPFF